MRNVRGRNKSLVNAKLDAMFAKGGNSQDAVKKESRPSQAMLLKQLKRILRILIPSWTCAEAKYMLIVAVAMILRTVCDLWMLSNSTAIERCIIFKDSRGFAVNIARFFISMLPISCVNQWLKYGLGELALNFRTRLTDHLFKNYLAGNTYYKLCNLDTRIANPDQLLTQDVDKFCTSLAELYSNLSKPMLDILVYSVSLTRSHGFVSGPLAMLSYLVVSGTVLNHLRAPISRFTVDEQKLEGEFRYVNSRIITSSEEIAFFQGQKREQEVVKTSFSRLASQLRVSMQFRLLVGIVDNVVAKYFATVVGFLVVSPPFLSLK